MESLLKIDNIEHAVHRLVGERDLVVQNLKSVQESLTKSRHEGEVLDGVKILLEALGKTGQESVKRYVEPLVTEALEYVFSSGMKFELSFVERRNQMEVDFLIKGIDGNSFSGSLEDTKGGGVLDVVCLVLRIVLAYVFKIEGPILVDEPTRFVDETHNPRVGSLLRELSERFKRQIILITHSSQLAAYGDKIYNVAMDPSGISHAMLEES